MCKSVRQTPHARTRSSTSPSPIRGLSRSDNVKSPGTPARWTSAFTSESLAREDEPDAVGADAEHHVRNVVDINAAVQAPYGHKRRAERPRKAESECAGQCKEQRARADCKVDRVRRRIQRFPGGPGPRLDAMRQRGRGISGLVREKPSRALHAVHERAAQC